jgi:hypothetical protein
VRSSRPKLGNCFLSRAPDWIFSRTQTDSRRGVVQGDLTSVVDSLAHKLWQCSEILNAARSRNAYFPSHHSCITHMKECGRTACLTKKSKRLRKLSKKMSKLMVKVVPLGEQQLCSMGCVVPTNITKLVDPAWQREFQCLDCSRTSSREEQ